MARSNNETTLSKFNSAIDKEIKIRSEELIDSIKPQDDLLTPQMQRFKIEKELHDNLDNAEFEERINKAVSILSEEGQTYLDSENYQSVLKALNELSHNLENLDLNHIDDGKSHEIFTVKPEILSLILKIAISKFSEEEHSESLSLFTLLTQLDREEPNYWYRLGLVAQKMDRYELALKAYEVSKNLSPEFIGSYIFAANCHIKLNNRQEAQANLLKAKSIADNTIPVADWLQRLADLERYLASS